MFYEKGKFLDFFKYLGKFPERMDIFMFVLHNNIIFNRRFKKIKQFQNDVWTLQSVTVADSFKPYL